MHRWIIIILNYPRPLLEVQELTIKIDISETDVAEKHKTFMEEYPKENMNKFDFLKCLMKDRKESYSILEPSQKVKAMEHGEDIFDIFDGDKMGTMNFMEFMMASHVAKAK